LKKRVIALIPPRRKKLNRLGVLVPGYGGKRAKLLGGGPESSSTKGSGGKKVKMGILGVEKPQAPERGGGKKFQKQKKKGMAKEIINKHKNGKPEHRKGNSTKAAPQGQKPRKERVPYDMVLVGRGKTV